VLVGTHQKLDAAAFQKDEVIGDILYWFGAEAPALAAFLGCCASHPAVGASPACCTGSTVCGSKSALELFLMESNTIKCNG